MRMPLIVSSLERQYGGYLALIGGRIRAFAWRLRGANLGNKSYIGRHCTIHRPWCFFSGVRTQFESQIYIKITGDDAEVRLGDNVFVGFGSQFDISGKLLIGSGVLIAPGCFITDHNHKHASNQSIAAQGCDYAPVRIGDDVWLGAHVVVLPGVIIGNGAIVGANAVVTKDVASMSIVAGVPAELIGIRMP
jgi:acetyltransferase-like isoleucine patch superfamily enzyme